MIQGVTANSSTASTSSVKSNPGNPPPLTDELKKLLISKGISEDTIKQGPGAVKAAADELGIDLNSISNPNANASSGVSLFGNGFKSQSLNGTDPKKEFEQKLIAAGIPQDIVQAGKASVEDYVNQHPEIKAQLPPPPPAGANFDMQM